MRHCGFFRSKKGIDQIIAALLMVVIVVIASVMVFTYSTGLFGALLIAPKTATENISLEYAAFSPTNDNVTLYIRNTGSTPITLKSYYVSDSAGDVYARINWASGPSVAPGPFPSKAQPSTPPQILISSACLGTCPYSGAGSGFTFVPGNPYTIVLVTSINTQFSLQVIR